MYGFTAVKVNQIDSKYIQFKVKLCTDDYPHLIPGIFIYEVLRHDKVTDMGEIYEKLHSSRVITLVLSCI